MRRPPKKAAGRGNHRPFGIMILILGIYGGADRGDVPGRVGPDLVLAGGLRQREARGAGAGRGADVARVHPRVDIETRAGEFLLTIAVRRQQEQGP